MSKILPILLMTMIAVPVFAHEGHHHGSHTQNAKEKDAKGSLPAVFGDIQQSYLLSVRPIFVQKCAACHSLDSPSPWYGKVPLVGWIVESDRSEAKEHLEISKGFPFAGHGTPEEDLQAIEEVVSKGSMPTFLYRALHPSSKLTHQEKSAVLEWVKSSRQKLNAAQKRN